MARPNIDVQRKENSSALFSLAEIFNNFHDVIVDSTPLRAAASRCRSGADSKKNEWSYHFDDLKIRIDQPQKLMPQLTSCELVLTVSGKFCGAIGDHDHDPFLKMDIELIAEERRNGLMFAWHIDRHECNHPAMYADPPAGSHLHPLYHFQIGGRALKNLDLGKTVLLPCPRIAIPPMDAVLAMDFVLSQFVPACWTQCRNNNTYRQLVTRAQNVYWQPYLGHLTDAWNCPENKFETCKARTLWPELLR